MPHVEVTLAEGVARVTLNRPPLNVLDLAAARELAGALERLRGQADVSVLVLGARGKAFSAGVDVRDHLPDRGEEMIRTFDRACATLLAFEVPTIAAVQGAALGAGCELAIACDLVVAAQEATFGLPEIRLGVFPPVAAVALPRMVPWQTASEMILTGRALTAVEAHQAGIANKVVPAAEVEYQANAIARHLRGLPRAALRAAKRAMSRGRPDAGELAAAERIYLDELLHHPDAVEGLTAFLEKRAPRWSS